MVDYIPYQITKNAAAGQGMRMVPGAISYAPNNLGVATKIGIPNFERGAAATALGKGKRAVTLLQYPHDVADDPQMGHHIIFEVSKVDKGAIKRAAAADRNKIKAFNEKINKEMARRQKANDFGFDGAIESKDQNRKQSIKNLIKANAIQGYKSPRELNKFMSSGGGAGHKDTTSLQASLPKKSVSTYIALYMPPTVSVSYNSNYGEQEIGMMAQIGHDAIKAFAGGASDERVKGMLDKAGGGLKQMALGALDTVAPGAKALAALETGQIITSRMELMFEGIGRRSFSYEFTFIPRSEKEAQTIEMIVKYFKLHMASDLKKGTGGREYTVPDVFDIKYMYRNGENNFLNRISTCVLASMDVSYGGDKYQTYPEAYTKDGRRGLPPQSTKVSLGFQELELITKDKIKDGF